MNLSTAIEINEHFIKLITAKRQVKGHVLADYSVKPISSCTDEQISAAISETLKKNNIKSRTANVCFSRNIVTVRNLHLPSQDHLEIASMIDLHIPRIVPYKKEETIFSYRLLGADEMGYTKVVLAIVQINALRRYIKITEKAGLSVDRIGLSSYGVWQYVLANSHSEMNAQDVHMLLDIDSTFSDFIIFTQEHLMFTRSINIGANDIQANEKLNLTKLLGEVRQSLVIYSNEERNKKPTKVFLAGAGISESLIKTIELELGLVAKFIPYVSPGASGQSSGVSVPPTVSLSAVTSLALGHNDKITHFQLPELAIDRSLKEKTRDLIVLGSCAIYAFFIICAIFLSRIYNQQNYLDKLVVRSQAIEKEMGGLTKELGRIDVVKSYLFRRKMPLFLFYQMQNIIPAEIFANYVEFNEGKVILRGQALQLSDVFKFVTSLEQSKYCKNLQTKYTRKKKIKDQEVTEFELNFNLSP